MLDLIERFYAIYKMLNNVDIFTIYLMAYKMFTG